MMLSRSFTRRAWAPLVIALAVPVTLQAQERVLGTWNGRVDKEMQLTIRGNNFSSNTLSGQQLNGRFRMQTALPREADGRAAGDQRAGLDPFRIGEADLMGRLHFLAQVVSKLFRRARDGYAADTFEPRHGIRRTNDLCRLDI